MFKILILAVVIVALLVLGFMIAGWLGLFVYLIIGALGFRFGIWNGNRRNAQ